MNDLSTVYVEHAVAWLPKRDRDAVRHELDAIITRRVDARVTRGESASEAERSVLTELGPPVGDVRVTGPAGSFTILGAPAHLLARRVVMPWVLALGALVFVAALAMEVSEGATAATALAAAGVQALDVVAHTTFLAAVGLAVIDAMTRRSASWSPQELVRGADRRTRVREAAASAAAAALAIGLLVWQHLASPLTGHAGARIPIIAPGLWSSWMPVLIAAVATAGVVSLVNARLLPHSTVLILASAGLEVLGGAVALGLAASGDLLNPELLARFSWLAGPAGPLVDLALVLGIASVTVTFLGTRYRELRLARQAGPTNTGDGDDD